MSSLDRILKEINLEIYLKPYTPKHKIENEDIKEKIKNLLDSLINYPNEISDHEEKTNDFFRSIWTKYDCKHITELFKSYSKIQPTLLHLAGTRDHFLHVFHVYLFGLRIITQIIEKTKVKFKEILKIKEENSRTVVFNHKYDASERIFYIWTLSSSFHDIAYPFEKIELIQKGLQNYADYSQFKISSLSYHLDYSDIIELESYFKKISALYGGKLEYKEYETGIFLYKKEKNSYLHKVLLSAFQKKNHGVISSVILLRIIEDLFITQLEDTKYKLDPDDYNKYIKYFFDDDVVRMALIIALHNLNKKEFPKFPKIKFREFPLAYILIIADELQEFLRKKIEYGKEKITLKNIPDIYVENLKNGIKIDITYILEEDEVQDIKDITGIMDHLKAIKSFWDSPIKTLEDRLYIEDSCKININIRYNSDNIEYLLKNNFN